MAKNRTRQHYNMNILQEKPEWRNWQTQQTQNLPLARAWGFESLLRHQQKPAINTEDSTSPALTN